MPNFRPGQVALLVAQISLGLLAMTICLPSMQEWPAIFGASQAAVQLTFSAYIVTFGGMQLVHGAWSDRIGRKPVLLFGLVLSAVGALLAALAPNIGLLIAARALQGAGTAANMVVGRALVQDLYTGHDRTRVMALVGASMGVIPVTATLVGGHLHVQYGWQANFILLVAVSAALFLAAWRGLASTPAKAPGTVRRRLSLDYLELARTRGFVPYVVLLACTSGGFYTFLAGAPAVFAGYGVKPDMLGWYMMTPGISYIVGNMLTSRLIRTHGERWLLMVGQLTALSSILLVVGLSLGGVNTGLALSLPLLILGVGHGMVVPPALTGTVGLVPAVAGTAAAVAGLMQQVGGALGGFLVGLVPHNGNLGVGLLMLMWTLGGQAALAALRRRP
ncbi:Bcr/CflA family efflux MFS transporter [Ramlibacter sp.]|uniref:Bcr/CflA family efflux MFS transporter n=1 Tax=Ramlibacter sp. TaxID=1917967 RepID=UPI003D10EFD1